MHKENDNCENSFSLCTKLLCFYLQKIEGQSVYKKQILESLHKTANTTHQRETGHPPFASTQKESGNKIKGIHLQSNHSFRWNTQRQIPGNSHKTPTVIRKTGIGLTEIRPIN